MIPGDAQGHHPEIGGDLFTLAPSPHTRLVLYQRFFVDGKSNEFQEVGSATVVDGQPVITGRGERLLKDRRGASWRDWDAYVAEQDGRSDGYMLIKATGPEPFAGAVRVEDPREQDE